MHSNNPHSNGVGSGGGNRYGNHLGVSPALGGGSLSPYLSSSLGGTSPSDIGGFGASSGESAFATTITATQRRQQKQMEIIAEMEKAARNGDPDALQNIIEEGVSNNNGESSHMSSEP